MKTNIVFLDIITTSSDGKKETIKFIGQERKFIKKTIKETAEHAGELLGIEGITVKFKISAFAKASPIWARGMSCYKELIALSVIPRRHLPPDKYINLRITIRAIVYHELHHWAREFYNGPQNVLIDRIFLEGLAIAFEEEQATILEKNKKEKTPIYKTQYSFYDPVIIQKLIPVLKTQRNNIDYDYSKWFGDKSDGLGYRTGKYFIELILGRFQYLSPAALVKASRDDLLDLLYQSGINLK
jgi:hypothetical protein